MSLSRWAESRQRSARPLGQQRGDPLGRCALFADEAGAWESGVTWTPEAVGHVAKVTPLVSTELKGDAGYLDF